MTAAGDRLLAARDEEAVAWSLAGSVLAAFSERVGCAYERCLADVVGTADIHGWAMDPRRQAEEVIAAAVETERRMFGV